MGTVYRKTATKALPAGAELFTKAGERFARWKDAKGKTRTALVTVGRDGQERITITARTYLAKYRDGQGIVREVATGCRDEQAARAVLNTLLKRAENVRSGTVTAADDAVIDWKAIPLAEHVAAYIEYQTAKELNSVRIKNSQSRIARLSRECRFTHLSDLNASAVERWLLDRKREGMSAGNLNEFRWEIIGFCNWCVRKRRLTSNPVTGLPRFDTNIDRQRQRRSMTEAELIQLLEVARWRPLSEYGRRTVAKDETERKGKRSNWTLAPLTFDDLAAAVERARERLAKRPEFIAKLERLGHERALIYKTLVLTGLRKGELASLTVGQLFLDGPQAFAELHAADEKNRQGSQIAIRDDLAADLRHWLAGKLESPQSAMRGRGKILSMQPTLAKLPVATKLFTIPGQLVKILDRDLKAAGIAKADERGRTLDVHALRHSFGTLLSRGGVAPRTAQSAMRHSSIDLTMNVYTDPKLLDVHGALDSLPSLPLSSNPNKPPETVRATGTNDLGQSPFAPAFAPTVGKPGQTVSHPGKIDALNDLRKDNPQRDVTCFPDAIKNPLSLCDSGSLKVERKGVEPSTSALRTQRSPN